MLYGKKKTYGNLEGKAIDTDALYKMVHSVPDNETMYKLDMFSGMRTDVDNVGVVFNIRCENPGPVPKKYGAEMDAWYHAKVKAIGAAAKKMLLSIKDADMRFCKEMGIDGCMFMPDTFTVDYGRDGIPRKTELFVRMTGTAIVGYETGEPIILNLLKKDALNNPQPGKAPVKNGAFEQQGLTEPFEIVDVAPEDEIIMNRTCYQFNYITEGIKNGKKPVSLYEVSEPYDLSKNPHIAYLNIDWNEEIMEETPQLDESLLKEPEDNSMENGFEM